MTAALVCGAVGDVFLSRDGEQNFLFGLGAFLVGHIAYIGLLLGYGDSWVAFASNPAKLGVCLVMFIIAWRSCAALVSIFVYRAVQN